jgi:putative drug exporter of the RND superfamily
MVMVTTNGNQSRTVAGERSRFYRLAQFSYRRRWTVLVVWLIVLAVALPAVMRLADRLSQGGFEVPGSQSQRVAQAVKTDFHRSDLTDSLVVHSASLVATDPEFRRVLQSSHAGLSRGPGVESVGDPYSGTQGSISADGHTAIAVVGLSGTQDDALKNADAQNAIVERASTPRVEALLTGSGPFYSQFSKTTTDDLKRAETIALPITLIILILAFGSLLAAGMPLVTAIFSLLISFGVLSVVAATTTVSIYTENVASMIGIGVGIDYALFIITRYREELRRGHDVPGAIGLSIASSGKAVFVSGLTVVVALAGTQLVDIQAFRSMGWGAMIAVAFAVAAALTLLPALLGFIGRKIDAMRIRRRPAAETSRLWHRWAMVVMRHPWTALIGSLVVLLVLALPALHLRLGSSGPSILPADSSPRVAAELAGKAFGEGAVSPVQVLVTDPRGVTGHGFDYVYDLSRSLARDQAVVPGGVQSIATLVRNATREQARAFVNGPAGTTVAAPLVAGNGTQTLIAVVTKQGPQSDQTAAFVERARDLAARTAPAGVTADAGGDAGLNVDINQELGHKLVPIVALVMGLSYLVLLLFFRSLLLPLKAVLMTTASVLAVYGVLVWVFQDGHLQGLLNFQAAGHIESFIPLFLFCILFGLSMDYEVFLLARIREEYLRTGDNTEAVGWGLEHTAAIITSAAAIMITVFGAFAFASLVPIKAMGFGLAIAVLIDATLVRIVLVPATMRLLGRWNWWLPGWLDRVLPDVSLEGPTEPAEIKEQVPVGSER